MISNHDGFDSSSCSWCGCFGGHRIGIKAGCEDEPAFELRDSIEPEVLLLHWKGALEIGGAWAVVGDSDGNIGAGRQGGPVGWVDWDIKAARRRIPSPAGPIVVGGAVWIAGKHLSRTH